MTDSNDQNDFNVVMTKKGLDLARRVSIIDVDDTTKDQLSTLKKMAKNMIPKKEIRESW